MSVCSFHGCVRGVRARGMCSTHWQRWAGYIAKPLADPIEATPGQTWLRDNAVNYAGDACLMWPFGIGTHGYGTVMFENKLKTAAHVCCILVRGKPPKGCEVLHSCNNRPCVNPNHLRWGTRKENVADSIAAGTFSYPPGRK